MFLITFVTRFVIKIAFFRLKFSISRVTEDDLISLISQTSRMLNMYGDLKKSDYPNQDHHSRFDIVVRSISGLFQIIWLLIASMFV